MYEATILLFRIDIIKQIMPIVFLLTARDEGAYCFTEHNRIGW